MLEFLAPLGWLVACAAVLPVGAALLRGRRDRRVRGLLGLRTPGVAARAGATAAAALAIGLLAAATARPAIRTGSTERVRTDAQVFFVVDISRSMLARPPGGRTRYDRAVVAAERLRKALDDVPAGIASLTDRPLPHLFPTSNDAVFSSVLRRSVGIERPPAEHGRNLQRLATNFDALGELGTAGYFGKRAKHRLVILLTDGESDLYTPRAVARTLWAGHAGLLVVRFWDLSERVYSNGRPETYRPEPRTLRPLRRLAATGLGLFDEHDEGAALRAARRWLGTGPTIVTGRTRHRELAPYAAAAALLPLAFVLRRRDP